MSDDTRPDIDAFEPGECRGDDKCLAQRHVHGCYTPHRADQCDAPNEHGHLPGSLDAGMDVATLIREMQIAAMVWQSPSVAALMRQAAAALAAERERADGLAAIIEQAPHTQGCDAQNPNPDDDHCVCWKSTTPSDALAAHDAEVKAQALDEAAVEARRRWEPYTCPWVGFIDDRAAEIRAKATS